ncbi:MAG TPA: outer membrane lipoprotein carrier protein LolA [Terriglobia bacterium]|nr:outer membrane lipoprotein carrier protein LolA [Terriglobia bacterium]
MNQRRLPNLRLSFRLRILWLLVVSLAALADSATDQLIQKVQDHYNSARTLSVHFVENYSILGHPRPPESGTLSLRKQGKMRWDYSNPPGKLFISDGKEVYLYTAADNRVEKVPLKDTEDMRAPLAFLLGRLDMKKEFRDFQTHPGDGGTWLDAAAKSDRLPYKEVQMLVRPDGSIEKLNVVGRDQSLLSYQFTDEKLNPHLNDGLFHFEVPPGAQVVDAVEYRSEGK